MSKYSSGELNNELLGLENIDTSSSKDSHYKTLFDSMSELVEIIELIYDENDHPIDFYIRDANKAFVKFFASTKDKLINKKMSALVNVIEKSLLISFANVDKTGKPVTLKNYDFAFDKHYFVNVWKVSENNIGVSFTDITKNEKEKQAKELAIAKELRQFIETTNTPVFGIDSDGLINEWNHSTEDVTGYKKAETLGTYWRKFTPKKYLEKIKKKLESALIGESMGDFEFAAIAKNGQEVIFLVSTSARRDASGKVTGVLAVDQNITKMVRCRTELGVKLGERTLKLNKALIKEKELNKLKSNFVSTTSHEFRTPLSAINLAVGAIKKYWAKMEPDMIVKKLHKIEDQVLHMTKLLDNILIFGQAEESEVRQNPTFMNFGNL
jgi:PAS domain S-box-containing protein